MIWTTKPQVGTPLNFASPLARGLVAYFPLNEGAGTRANSLVYGRAGTITGHSPSATSGWTGVGKGNQNTNSKTFSYIKPAHGYLFDATDDLITVNNFPFLSTFSVAFWASDTASATDVYRNAVSRGSVFENSTNFSCGIRTKSARQLHCYWRSSGGTLGGLETLTFSFNGQEDWNHYVFTWDGATVRFYLNSALVASGASSGGTLPADGSQALKIGNSNTNTLTDSRWSGGISEVMVYNRAVSGLEVKDIYSNIYKLYLAPLALKRYLNEVAVVPPDGSRPRAGYWF